MRWKFGLSRQSDVFALAVSVEDEHVETSVASTSYLCVFIKETTKKSNELIWASCIYVAPSKMQCEGKMIFAAFQSTWSFILLRRRFSLKPMIHLLIGLVYVLNMVRRLLFKRYLGSILETHFRCTLNHSHSRSKDWRLMKGSVCLRQCVGLSQPHDDLERFRYCAELQDACLVSCFPCFMRERLCKSHPRSH